MATFKFLITLAVLITVDQSNAIPKMKGDFMDMKLSLRTSRFSSETNGKDSVQESGSMKQSPEVPTVQTSDKEQITDKLTSKTVDVMTTDPTTNSPPKTCFGASEYKVADYSEAIKYFWAKFTDMTFSDCCEYAESASAYVKYYSFSYEDGECTYYKYVPYKENVPGPPPTNGSSDKTLYVKEPQEPCEYYGGMQGIYIPSGRKAYKNLDTRNTCEALVCNGKKAELFLDDPLYYTSNEQCLGIAWVRPADRKKEHREDLEHQQLELFKEGLTLPNVFNDEDEKIFLELELSDFEGWFYEVIKEDLVDEVVLDIIYEDGQYKWRQSGRIIPDNFPKWEKDFPSDERNGLVVLGKYGMKDVKLLEAFPLLYRDS